MKITLIVVLLLCAAEASAVLWWDNGLPDGRNGLLCCYWSSYGQHPLDAEVVDNFEVGDPGWLVNVGHFRMVTMCGHGADFIDGVNVFFYDDVGGKPSLERHAERVAEFTAYTTGDYYFGRPEIAIDVEFDTVTVLAGWWWVCFQPVLEEGAYWLTAESYRETVWFSCPELGYPKWTDGYDVFGDHYDVSFQLGWIPEPAAFTAAAGMLLGIGGIVWRRKQIGR